jgi:glycosidase
VSATDAEGRTATAEIGFLPPQVVDLPRPEGLEDGITYVDDSTVRLSLFAPYKSFVHVIGEFNDWTVSNETLLYRDTANADSTWWWTEVSGLNPGQEVAFQYLVDGTLRVADPYSEKILDPNNDPFIPQATYPTLKPYPTGPDDRGRYGDPARPGPAYEWTTTGYQRPAYEDLVIYELLVRDFTGAQNFQTLADTLDYLERLGVNAIELMPVSEFGGNLNWGYQPTFHLAVDKYYGPRDALKALVDAAHARGMAVILDVVYNHADAPSPLVTLYGCTEGAPYTNNPERHPFNVFCDLNHESAATQYWLDRANRYWLEEFRVDGFRYDLSKGFTQRFTRDVGVWSSYDASRIRLLKRMADRVWDVDPAAYVILEHFAENREEQELAAYGRPQGRPGMLLWNNMNHAYSEAAMGYLNAGSNFRNTWPPNRAMPVTGLVTYMESHDEQWMMLKNRRFGNSSPDGSYNVRTLWTALERQQLAGTFFFTIPGPRMMWQFGELGYGGGPGECLKPGGSGNGDCAASDPGRTGVKPLPWTAPRQYHLDPDRQRLYKTWAALINLRRSQPVFTSPQTTVEIIAGQNVAGRRIKLALEDVEVVIVGNFGVEPTEVNPAFHRAGTWYEFFSDTELEVTDPTAPLLLAPGEARIYSTVDFPSPEAGIYQVSGEQSPSVPLAFRLDAPFPNPSAGQATVAFALAEAGHARLEVFDLLGRRVAVAVDEPLAAGPHRAGLDTATLPSGTYVLRLVSGEDTAAVRLTVLR